MSTTTTEVATLRVTGNVRGHGKHTNLPQDLLDTARAVPPEAFDPKKHLAFQEPKKLYTFEDLNLPPAGISNCAVSEPFPLFSEDAVKQLRAEVFSERVVNSYHCQTSPTSGIIRGYCPTMSEFVYNAWHSQEMIDIISRVAGVKLVPAMDYDVGHVNVSVNSDGQETDVVAPGKQSLHDSTEFCESAFGWHKDSYNFVVVTMLSDCTGMVGGETAIRMGNDEVMTARGPALGTAVVMQGSFVEHQARAAKGGKERTSMVTSFRPKDPKKFDATRLDGTRSISHLPTLYTQFFGYRFENMEDSFREELRNLRKRQVSGLDFDVAGTERFLLQQKASIERMLQQIQR